MSITGAGVDFTVYRGSNDGTIKESTTHQDPLKSDQVLVKITHSGLCGTDEHYRSNDQVLGHEGAGVVQEVGPDVRSLKKYAPYIAVLSWIQFLTALCHSEVIGLASAINTIAAVTASNASQAPRPSVPNESCTELETLT